MPESENGTSSTSKMPSRSLSCQPTWASDQGSEVWLVNAVVKYMLDGVQGIEVLLHSSRDMILLCRTYPAFGLSGALVLGVL